MPAAPAVDTVPPVLRAEIDTHALARNVRRLLARDPAAVPVGVVKADAYGHGAVCVARVLRDEGVERLAVATLAEAVALREAGIAGRLLVLAAPFPEHLPAYAYHGFGLSVTSREVADAVVASGLPLIVHVKVDTGMHRLGLAPEEVPGAVHRLQAAGGVTVESLWTHFATADAADASFVATQLVRFTAVLDALGDEAPPLVHADNGPAFVRSLATDALAGRTRLVRLGGALYGLASSPALADAMADLEPVMRLVSRVVHLQTVAPGESVSYGRTWTATAPTRIATIAGGYADGLPRAMQRSAVVGIGGALWPVAGRVCMDMIMLDLGPPDGPSTAVRLGDDAVLWGPGGPTAEATAAACGTISYELTSSLTARVPRLRR